jgi:hypothetical protein
LAPEGQYVVLQMYAPGENFVSGQKVQFYDAAGATVGSATFGANLAFGDNQDRVLVATAQAQSYFGLTADLTMSSPWLDPAGGKVCYAGGIDCVAWGAYTGSAAGVGSPAPALPSGVALQRRLDIAGLSTQLDAADDTGDSASDFVLAAPQPRNNARESGSPQRLVGFPAPTFDVDEDVAGGVATVTVKRLQEFGSASYATAPGSASAADYTTSTGTLSGWTAENTTTFMVPVVDDSEVEGDETVLLTLSSPTDGAVLGRTAAVLRIHDDEIDPTKPSSRVTRPKNNTSYRRGKLTALSGTASDAGGSGLARVQVSIRQTLDNGKCRWFTGSGFASGSCSRKQRWQNASGTGSWTLSLGSFRLPKSRRADPVAFYTAYSRAHDAAGNVESSFTSGRNANRFEII